jgi:putative ABC transport system permease protein
LPLSGASAGRGLTIEGRVVASPQDEAGATYRLSCPGYFATIGIPLLEGRDFAHGDVTGGHRVAIVNRAMAVLYWPGKSPLGRRVKLGPLEGSNPWLTVVGVVDDIRHFGLDSEASREIYLPYSQQAWPVMTIVAKTVGDPMAWQSAMKDCCSRRSASMACSRTTSRSAPGKSACVPHSGRRAWNLPSWWCGNRC